MKRVIVAEDKYGFCDQSKYPEDKIPRQGSNCNCLAKERTHYGVEKNCLADCTTEEGPLLYNNCPYHTHCAMIGAMILERSGRIEGRRLAHPGLDISRVPTCAVAGRRVDNIIEVLPRYCRPG